MPDPALAKPVVSGLSAVPDLVLRRLADELTRGTLRAPLSSAALQARGIGQHAPPLLASLGTLDVSAISAVLAAVLAERAAFDPPGLELVWTGPTPSTTQTRSTGVVVRELFASARRSVLIGGFRFDHGADLLAPLHTAMSTRGVRADIFMDIKGAAPTRAEAPAFAAEAIARFMADNWPFGELVPTLWYDPRTACPGPPWVSLHAKCVVVDRRLALMTSANFTERGQTRNLEAGVLIDDEAFASRLCDHWQRLVVAGSVVRAN